VADGREVPRERGQQKTRPWVNCGLSGLKEANMSENNTELGNETNARCCLSSIKHLQAARITAVPGAFRTTLDEMIVIEHVRLQAILNIER
jgi:hypothetical protein